MNDIFVQRSFDPPLDDESFDSMGRDAMGCLDLYRVQWRQSFLSLDCLLYTSPSPRDA